MNSYVNKHPENVSRFMKIKCTKAVNAVVPDGVNLGIKYGTGEKWAPV